MYATVCDKLYSRKRCILEEGKQLGDETVGLKYPFWLLCINDGRCICSANDGYTIDKHATSISMVSLHCLMLLLKREYAESEAKERGWEFSGIVSSLQLAAGTTMKQIHLGGQHTAPRSQVKGNFSLQDHLLEKMLKKAPK